MQAVLTVESLPVSGIAASAAFFSDYLEQAKIMLAAADTTALAIVLPEAGTDHDDWRRSLAGDLAREYTPKRVNVIGAKDQLAAKALIDYLRDAPGVTGQYCPAHG
ncbi:Rossmann fold domain-containing protein [Erythrobacter crassostreae]|uniref:Short chain dehydrogenase-like proteobacteria domain-containing protein n=1 Tax=Erythrobacter crassostreae TaxID=2828328 RepID=A0A9X1JPL6_9SPHN|nr:hypothetical protein [Erythrobacter crassostrea]MBV7259552.1 hypothetical protein [Erythrobacter crassostrea]